MPSIDHASGAHASRARFHSAINSAHQSLIERLEDRRLFTGVFGTTDTSFGTLGHVIISTPNAKTTPQVDQLLTGPDGMLYAAGSAGVTRFTPEGAVDKTFGTKGVASLAGGSFVAESIDPQDQVYVLVEANSNAVLLRYTRAGILDINYGEGGTALVSSDANFTPQAMDVQSDGKLVVAGTEATNSGKGQAMKVFRINTDGSVDSGFGTSGSVQASLGTPTFLTPVLIDKVVGVKVLGSGEILVGGGSVAYSPSTDNSQATLGAAEFATALITTGGQLDSNYGHSGISRSQYASAGDVAGSNFESNLTGVLPSGFSVHADGSCVVAASFNLDGNTVTDATTMDSHGVVGFEEQLPSDGLGDAGLAGLVALNDGRAVLLRNSSLGSNAGFALTPLMSDGSLGQTVLTDDLNGATTDITGDDPAAIAIAPGGQLLVAGTPNSGGGYELQQLHQGSPTAPRSDNFANATANSLVADTIGNVYLAFYNTSTRSLQYAHRFRNGLWSSPVVVDSTPGAGQFLSLAVTSNGQPSISYYDPKTRHLRLASSIDGGKTFSSTIIDAHGITGLSSSLYIDPTSGAPSIAYYAKSSHSLRFATIDANKKWVISTIDSGHDVGRDVVLAPTYQTGRMSVAYVDNTAREVKWASLKNGKWQIKIAANSSKGADSLSMGYDSADQPAIAFRDLSTNELRLAIFSGRFTTATIQTNVGAGTGLAFPDPYGDASVYSYNQSFDTVQVISDPVTSRNISTAVADGGRDLSISAPGSVVAMAAYVDSASGDLQVRPVAES